MWLLHMLPIELLEYVVNLILTIGIVLTVLSFVFLSPLLRIMPAIAGYYKIIQIVSLVILCAGIYIRGGYSTETLWRERVAAVEEKLKIAEAKSEQVNEIIKEKLVVKNQIIKEKGEDIIRYIDREIVKKEEVIKFIEVCPIPVDIIKLHNAGTRINLLVDESVKGKK